MERITDDDIDIDEVTEADDPFSGFDTEEDRDRVRRMRTRSGFTHALGACGLSTEEAMEVLGQSRSTIEKKRSGKLPMTADDAVVLSKLWHRIRVGKIEGLPDGPFSMAVTMLVLRGKHVPKRTRRGRPRYVPTDAPEAVPS